MRAHQAVDDGHAAGVGARVLLHGAAYAAHPQILIGRQRAALEGGQGFVELRAVRRASHAHLAGLLSAKR